MEPVIEMQLDKEALEVPCQLTWIADLIPTFEQSAIEKIGTLEEHLQSLVKISEKKPFEDCGFSGGSDADEDDDQQSTSGNRLTAAAAVAPPSTSSTIFLRAVGKKLTKVAFFMYLGDFKTAKEILKRLRKTVSMLSTDRMEKTEGYWEAINYCMDASGWQIKFLERLKSGGNEYKAEDAFLEINIRLEKLQLSAKWKELSRENNKFVACIEFFKGRLGKSLKVVKLEASRNHFNKAAEMDEDCHVWSRHVYWELRKDRQVAAFRDGARQPTEKETHYCNLGYVLAPDDTFIKFDYALLLKDELWDKEVSYWNEHSGKVELCVTLFDEALEDFKQASSDRKWIELSSTFLAEVLLRRGEESDVQRGIALLEGFPESSTTLHKLAKFYRYGLRRDRSYRDFDKAEETYLKALMVGIVNYPCLMEFMKFLSQRRKHTRMMQVTDMYLDASKRDDMIIEVLMERGCLIWSANDGILGSQSWVDALAKFPSCAERVYSTARALIAKQKEVGIVNEEALADLEKACDRFIEAEEYAKVDVFIHELKTITERRWPYPDKTGSIAGNQQQNPSGQQRQRQNWNQSDQTDPSSTDGYYNTRPNSRFQQNWNRFGAGASSSFTTTVVGYGQPNSRFQQDWQPLQQFNRSISDRYHPQNLRQQSNYPRYEADPSFTVGYNRPYGGGRQQHQNWTPSEADQSDNWRR